MASVACTNACTGIQNPAQAETAQVESEAGGEDSGEPESDEGDQTAGRSSSLSESSAKSAIKDDETLSREGVADTVATAAPTAQALVDALAILERLPLTDTERAEAVRRLLGRPDESGDVQAGPEAPTAREPTGGGVDV